MSVELHGLNSSSRNNSLKGNNFRSESFSEERDLEAISESGCLSIIVLGASGDLAKKKTLPALFNLFGQHDVTITTKCGWRFSDWQTVDYKAACEGKKKRSQSFKRSLSSITPSGVADTPHSK